MLKRLQTAILVVPLFCISVEVHAGKTSGASFSDALAEVVTIFEAGPGRAAIRQWTPGSKGSVRLIGWIQKQALETDAVFHVVVEGKTIWSRTLHASDSLRHGFDIVGYELRENSMVEFRVVAGAQPVRVKTAFQIVPEPFVSRWRADLPTGYPTWSEDEKQRLRAKGQDILQRIRDASAAKAGKLLIPPGDYLFHARWSHASTLKSLAALEIVAEGVTFWFEPPMVHGLLFENCRDVTVRGLTIDFTIPIFTQARITEIDRKNKSIRADLMAGYEPRGEAGKPETAGERKLIFYDADGVFINHRHTRGDWMLSDDGDSILYSEVRVNPIPRALKVGDYVVSPIQTGAALRSKECARMRYEDVNIWSSPGTAVYEGQGEGGHVYQRLRATRRPHTNRLQAFGADVFHLSAADRGPTLERCESAYGADDNLNIHGRFGRVIQRVDATHYYLDGVYETGDTLEFRNYSTVELLGIAKAISVQQVADAPSLAINEKFTVNGEYLVELDRPLELSPLSFVVFDGKRSAHGFIVRDCWFHDNFQRTLINGAPNGLIENTTLQNVGHGLNVQFETWGPWMEGPFARNLIIRDNRFLKSPPDDAAINVSMHPVGSGSNRRRFQARPVTNMTITGNYFERTTSTPLNIHNVEGLNIHDNSIDQPMDAAVPQGLANGATLNWVYLQDCSNVTVRDNLTPGTQRMANRNDSK